MSGEYGQEPQSPGASQETLESAVFTSKQLWNNRLEMNSTVYQRTTIYLSTKVKRK